MMMNMDETADPRGPREAFDDFTAEDAMEMFGHDGDR